MTDTVATEEVAAEPPPRIRRKKAKPFAVIPLADNLEEMPLPNGAPYFAVGRKLAYVHKNMFFGRVLVPISEIPVLPDLPGNIGQKGALWLNVPPFPATLLGQAWSFFRWAWDERKSEAMLDITYDPEHGYRFFVPPQTASAGGVKCIRNEEHYRSALIGTIHSHCNMAAYHSGTDTHDADSHDGLHMTMGRVSANQPELDIMVAANRVRWDRLKREDVIDDPGNLTLTEHPAWWENYHEHADAIKKFKGQKFAAGSKPTGSHTPATSHGHGGGIWDGPPHLRGGNHGNKKPSPATPFTDHRMSELPDLVDEITTLGLIPANRAYDWSQEVWDAIDLLGLVVADFDRLGIEVLPRIWANRKKLDEYLDEVRKNPPGRSLSRRANDDEDSDEITIAHMFEQIAAEELQEAETQSASVSGDVVEIRPKRRPKRSKK